MVLRWQGYPILKQQNPPQQSCPSSCDTCCPKQLPNARSIRRDRTNIAYADCCSGMTEPGKQATTLLKNILTDEHPTFSSDGLAKSSANTLYLPGRLAWVKADSRR
eukprot:scpid110531/ scgid33371/ 